MDTVHPIIGVALCSLFLACGGAPVRSASGGDPSTGVVESIGHLDRTASAGVAGVLASGALKTPAGASNPPAGAAPAMGASGAIASVIAAPSTAPGADSPGYRVTVRMDSGALKSVDQPEVVGLRVGQRVRIEKDRVLPRD